MDQEWTVCSVSTVMQARFLEVHGARSRVVSRRTLSTVSHALGMAATALGSDAVVVACFERRAHFEPRLHAYQRMVERGAVVAVAHVGSRATDGCGFHVPLQVDDTAADVWALAVFSPTLCGFVCATEHGTYADAALGLTPAHRFAAEIGFDGERTSEVLDELREMFGDRLDGAVVDKIDQVAVLRAQQVRPNTVEVAWESALTSLTAHVETPDDTWIDTAPRAPRSQLTGLTNPVGLDRSAGVAEDTTLPTPPPVGMLMFDLDEFQGANNALGLMNDAARAAYYKGVAELMDVLPERVIRYRLPDLEVLYCNAAWAAGHDLHPDEVVGRALRELLSEHEQAGLEAQLARFDAANPLIADDVPRPAPNAPGQWVEWVDQYLQTDEGAEVIAVGRDVTGRHIAELNLAASEERFRDLADRSADVVWRFVTEPFPHFDYMSPSVQKTLGYPASLFLDDFTRFLDILDDEGRDLVVRALNGELMPERCDMRYRCANGETVIGEMQTTAIHNGLQGVSRDVTELRRLQGNLVELALRDSLTGLANRRLLLELLDASLARAARDDTPLAVLFLDLDGFKAINDIHGHDAGDTVLCETARRLLSTVRGADVVARLGSDEFVVVYEPSRNDNLMSRVTAALTAPIAVAENVEVRCPASVGRADTSIFGHDAASLLAAADAAMYEAKRLRRSATVLSVS